MQQIRTLLPKHSRTPHPTDAQILAAVRISEGRLWVTPENCDDTSAIRIHCAPKERDHYKGDMPGPFSPSAPPQSEAEAASSTRHTSVSVHRHQHHQPMQPHPPSVAAPLPKWQPHARPPKPQQVHRARTPSTSRSATPPRRTRRSTRPSSTSPGSATCSKLSTGDVQRIAQHFHQLQCQADLKKTRKLGKDQQASDDGNHSDGHEKSRHGRHRALKKRKIKSAD